MKKWTLLAVGILALSACQDNSNTKSATPAAASTPAAQADTSVNADVKTYRVAIEREFTPLIVPGENGAITGFEADILQEIAKVQGFQLQFLTSAWENVFPQLDNGTVDIAGSGIIMTEERLQKWDFSEPFIVAKYAVIVPENSSITKSEDLQTKRVAVQPHSAFDAFARSKSPNIVSTQTIWVSIKETVNGHADAAMVNTVIGDHFVAKYPNEKLKVVAFESDADIPLGFAVKKGNTELKQQLDEGLSKIKANGTYEKLKEKWGIKR